MFRSGFITLLGLPNAGKSSLLNHLVGEDIAIISPKAQTTRNILRGYVVKDDLRLIVTDTPGLQEGTKALNQVLTKNATKALSQATKGEEILMLVIDTVALLLSIKNKKPHHLDVIGRFAEGACGKTTINVPIIPVFNKSDLLNNSDNRKEIERVLREELSKHFSKVEPAFWVSTREDEGIEELFAHLKTLIPLSEENIFEEDHLTDQNTRDLVAEFIREQCFLKLAEEVPYSVAIEIESFNEKKADITSIEATLHVEKESQKAIVVGAGGRKVKEIGISARTRIENFLNKKVFLGLKVKVTEQWSTKSKHVERFGYELQ